MPIIQRSTILPFNPDRDSFRDALMKNFNAHGTNIFWDDAINWQNQYEDFLPSTGGEVLQNTSENGFRIDINNSRKGRTPGIRIMFLPMLLCKVLCNEFNKEKEDGSYVGYTKDDLISIIQFLDLTELVGEEKLRSSFNDLLSAITEKDHPFGYIQFDEEWRVTVNGDLPKDENKIPPIVDSNRPKWILSESILAVLFICINIYLFYPKTSNQLNTEYADQLFKDQNYEDALREYEKVRDKINNDIPIEFQGELYEKLGKSNLEIGLQKGDKDYYKKAISCWKIAVKKFNPNSIKKDFALLHLSEIYWYINETTYSPQSLEKMKECIDKMSQRNKILTAMKFRQLGMYYSSAPFSIKKINRSIYYVKKAQETLQNKEPFNNDLANVYMDRYHLTEDKSNLNIASTIYHSRSKLLSEKADPISYAINQFGIAHCEYHIGLIDSSYTILNQSRKKLLHILGTYELMENQHLISSTLLTLGKTEYALYTRTDDVSRLYETIKYINRFQTTTNYSNPTDQANVSHLLGNSYYELSKHESERENLICAIDKFEKNTGVTFIEDSVLHVITHGYLASAYHRLGEITRADYAPKIGELIQFPHQLVKISNDQNIRQLARVSLKKLTILSNESNNRNEYYLIMMGELKILSSGSQKYVDEVIESNRAINRVLDMIPRKN